MNPLISVIIPAYNSADTIVEALESVRAQTVFQRSAVSGQRSGAAEFSDVGRGIEIIVVDDASSDGTADIAEKWLQLSGFKFQVLRSPRNAGPAAARNLGIAAAKGEWIAFLDADDAWLPEKLEMQLQCAREQPEVALWCGEIVGFADSANAERGTRNAERGEVCPQIAQMNADGSGPSNADGCCSFSPQVSGLRSQPSGLSRRSSRAEADLISQPFHRLPLEEFARHNPVATSTVLVRKNALRAVGGFDERFRGPEDYDLWMRVAARFLVRFIDTPLARYRYGRESLSNDDRTFLPSVLGVLDKAFAPGGALSGLHHSWRKARSVQYVSASWMAYHRGAIGLALTYLLYSWCLFAGKIPKEETDRLSRLRLLWRYLFGRRND